MPKKGEKYQHYKGNVYMILCIAKIEADMTDAVVYQDVLEPDKIWVRPLKLFMEEIDIQGSVVPRFKYIEG